MIEFDPRDVIAGRYEIVDEFGRGGMGVVLRVVDRHGGDYVALKYCRSSEPLAQKRFGREVRIIAGISHPNVMHVLDCDETHDPPYFTMPIAISSLRDEINSDMPIGDALDIFKDICLGVQAIHGSGSTH